MKQVDAYIKSDEVKLKLFPEEKHNLRFHLAMFVAFAKLRRTDYRPLDVKKIDLDTITPDFLSYCLNQVVPVFRRMRANSSRLPDTIAKSRDFSQALQDHFKLELLEASNQATHS